MRAASVLVFVCWAAPAVAQSASGAGQADALDALLQRLAKLEERVNTLEAENLALRRTLPAPAANAPAPATEVPGPAAIGHEDVAMPQGSLGFPTLRISGFMDVEYAAISSRSGPGGFNLGQFAVQLASRLSPKINFFGEVSVTPRTSAFVVELERSFVRYDYNDAVKLSAGRFHTPVNYWNTAFHHGTYLQTTITRPEMTRFGGMMVPVHFVGIQAEGTVTASRMGLGYNVGVGNGRGTPTGRAGDAGDVNRHRAWLVALHARPRTLAGVQVGGAYYRDQLSVSGGPQFSEALSSLHFVWNREPLEAITEFIDVRHRRHDGGVTLDNRAWYAQLAYRLPWHNKRMKPYFRHERLRGDPADVLLDIGDTRVNTAGIRYDFGDLVALKSEFRRTSRALTRTTNGVYFQASLAF